MPLLWSRFITLFPHKMRPESPAWKSARHLSRLYQVSELILISSPFPHYTSCVWSCKQAEHCVIVLGTLLTKAREEQKLEPELMRLINKRKKKNVCVPLPELEGLLVSRCEVIQTPGHAAPSQASAVSRMPRTWCQFVLYAIRILLSL